MSITHATEGYTALPDDETLAATASRSKSMDSASKSSPTSILPAKLSSPASPKALP